MKYFIKMINYKNNINDYMIVISKTNIELIVKYSQIILAYKIGD